MSTANQLQDYQINPRLKTAALWVSMLFIFVYVDLFSLFRADVRADIEAGKIFAFTIGQGVMLGMIVYVLVPSLMVFLTLVLPVRVTRVANLVLAVLYALTVAGGAIGEWSYYVLGSAVEVVLLAGIAYYAWTWPKAADAPTFPADQSRASSRVHASPQMRE